MTVELRPSTPSDVALFFPDPLPWRIRAVTMIKDDMIVGLGGMAYLPDGTIGMFAKLTDEARAAKVSLHKAGIEMMRQVRELGFTRIVAMADPEEPAAERWLRRFGFRPVDNAWVWEKE